MTEILMIIIGLGMVLIASCVNEKDAKKRQENGIIVHDMFAKYMGGLPDITGDKNITISVKENNIFISFQNNLITKDIPMNSVVNAEIKSETQITNEVGLGKILVFGVLAFGMKNKKTHVENYLLLTYKDIELNQIVNMVIFSRQLEQLTQTIRKYSLGKDKM